MFAIALKVLASTGGRFNVRRLVYAALAVGVVSAGSLPAQAADAEVAVTGKGGVYDVRAAFTVSRAPAVVRSVLTDYARIPRYMPQFQTSRLLKRDDGRAVVEQEAVSRFLTFSKRVHLVLEVRETPLTIEFSDRCGQSFERYEGAWSMMEKEGETRIAYRLTAKPAFDVPTWLLSRLLKRDAAEMIQRLQAEIAAR